MKKVLAIVLSLVMMFGVFSTSTTASPSKGEEKYYSVVFNDNNIPSNFEDKLTSYGGEIVYEVPEIGFIQIKGNSSLLNKVKGLQEVRAINPSIQWSLPETNEINYVSDDAPTKVKGKKIKSDSQFPDGYFWPLQWDIQRITENGKSYELGTGSHDVVVGIIDTGIDRDHPDLVANLMPGSKNFVPAGGLYGLEPNETGDINAFDDLKGHGSHVAGSIAANGALLGVAPDIGIRAYRVFGTSSAQSSWILNAMIAAANDEVDVISMSLGGFDILGQVFYVDPETGDKEALGNDVADFVAYGRAVKYAQDKNCLVVVASGNDAMNITNKSEITDFLNAEYGGDGYIFVGAGFNVPAWYPGVVSVSATGPNDELALYSNYGPGSINIAAPGGDQRLLYQYWLEGREDEYWAQRLYYNEFCLSTSDDGWYYFSIGTSMATPKVSAVAALIIDKYGDMPQHKVAEMLYKKGVDPVSGTDKAYFGNGHLNAYNALMD